VCVKARASQTEHLCRLIQRRLVGQRGQFQITGARARNQHIAKELAFGFVHAHMDGEDFVGAPVWHAGSDEHGAAAQFVAGLGTAPRSVAYAARRQTLRGRDALPDARVRVLPIELCRRVVRRPRAVRQELNVRAFNELRFMHVAG